MLGELLPLSFVHFGENGDCVPCARKHVTPAISLCFSSSWVDAKLFPYGFPSFELAVVLVIDCYVILALDHNSAAETHPDGRFFRLWRWLLVMGKSDL